MDIRDLLQPRQNPAAGFPAPRFPVLLVPGHPTVDPEIEAAYARTIPMGDVRDCVITCIKFWKMLRYACLTNGWLQQATNWRLLLAADRAFQNWIRRKRALKDSNEPLSLLAQVGEGGVGRDTEVGAHLNHMENLLVRACALQAGILLPREAMTNNQLIADHEIEFPFLWPTQNGIQTDLGQTIAALISQVVSLHQTTKWIENAKHDFPYQDLRAIIYNLPREDTIGKIVENYFQDLPVRGPNYRLEFLD